MKRIIIISSFAATALFTLTGGVQAQNSIEQVLKNIETNNKELQANAQLITSQKLESKTDNNLPDPTLSYAHLWGAKDKNETIGELVVSQSFDFPSLYATRNKLNRWRRGLRRQADVFRQDKLCRRKKSVWTLSCSASRNKFSKKGSATRKYSLKCMPNVSKPETPTPSRRTKSIWNY